ncbi:MAG: tripartite tricarboxylate transporter substrate binding protein, partial [Betaproteobacteria bacterium]|nr:tripartite tricarboxylate transporter substrate binding protein [Betaproteobacteria bacterium]
MRALIASALVAVATLAHAQEYPVRPLRLIVPLPAGSTT